MYILYVYIRKSHTIKNVLLLIIKQFYLFCKHCFFFFRNMHTCHPKGRLSCKGCCLSRVSVSVARISGAWQSIGMAVPWHTGTLNKLAQWPFSSERTIVKFSSIYSLIVIGFHSDPTHLGSLRLRQEALPTLWCVASVCFVRADLPDRV